MHPRFLKISGILGTLVFFCFSCGTNNELFLFTQIASGQLIVSLDANTKTVNKIETNAIASIVTTTLSEASHVERIKVVLKYFIPPSPPFMLPQQKEISVPLLFPADFESCATGTTGLKACDSKEFDCSCLFQPNETKQLKLRVQTGTNLTYSSFKEACLYSDSAQLFVYATLQENRLSHSVLQVLPPKTFSLVCLP